MANEAEGQRFVPRNPRSAFHIDEVREISHFLTTEKPPSPGFSELKEDSSSKRSSGVSRGGSRRGKVSIEFLRAGRKHFKSLLRSRSSSPPAIPRNIENTYVVEKISLVRQQVPGGNKQYTRILRDSSQTDSLDNLSTYRVNYVVDSRGAGESCNGHPEGIAKENLGSKKQQSLPDHAPNAAVQNPSNPIHQEKTDSGKIAQSEMSQKASLERAQKAIEIARTLPRPGTAPQIRDFAEGGPRFPDLELIATIGRKKRRSGRKRVLEEWTDAARPGPARQEATATMPNSSSRLAGLPQPDNKSLTDQQRRPQAVMRTPSAFSSDTHSAERPSTGRPSKESTIQSFSVSDSADAATDITVPSSTRIPVESSRIRRTASPKPAPTGPLPPLPEGANGSIVYSKSLHDRPSISASSLSAVPPRSPARNRQPLSVVSNTRPSQKPRSALGSDLKWPYPPASQTPSRTTSEVNFACPGIQESNTDDPFLFRAQKTGDLKRRDVQQSRVSVGKDSSDGSNKELAPQEDSDDNIVVLPSRSESLPKGSTENAAIEPTSQGSEVNAGPDPQPPRSLLTYAPVETILDQKPSPPRAPTRPPSLTLRTTYRSHSTQYSPTHGSSGTLDNTSSRGPSLIVTDHGSNILHNWSVQEPSHQANPRASASTLSLRSASPAPVHRSDLRQNGIGTHPSESVLDIHDLEARMEARIAGFEQKTMLLEAALLGVINASASAATE
ncbi:MAG: hypothetical protein LQ340_005549, partial [Diploschistes diacapsis]